MRGLCSPLNHTSVPQIIIINGVYNEEDDSYNEEEDDSDNEEEDDSDNEEEEEEEEEEMGMGWGAEEDLGAEDIGYPYD